MKHLLVIILLATFSCSAFSQSTFSIQKPMKNSSYESKMIKSMGPGELKGILGQVPDALGVYKTGTALNATGLLLLALGSGTISFGTLTGEDYLSAGLLVAGVGLVLALVGLGQIKKSLVVFNEGVNSSSLRLSPWLNQNQNTGFAGGLSLSFSL